MNEDWIIRKKEAGDEAEAGRLIAESFRELYAAFADGDWGKAVKIAELEMYYRGRMGNLFVAARGDKIIGVIEIISMEIQTMRADEMLYISFKQLGSGKALRASYLLSLMTRELQSDEAGISSLAVAADERRSGVARALLTRAEEFTAQIGKKRLALWVAESSAPAVKLYESSGFTTVDITSSFQMKKFFGLDPWRHMSKAIDSPQLPAGAPLRLSAFLDQRHLASLNFRQ
jgi:ribosomal protein S18 acetylase RimI-like enzyme